MHGEAVVLGIALDTTYSALAGLLSDANAKRIIELLIQLGFEVTHPLMQIEEGSAMLSGLKEFQEHLGGRLTIMLLRDIGKGEEVHQIDTALLIQAAQQLKHYS